MFFEIQVAFQNGRISIGQGLRQNAENMRIGLDENYGSCKEKGTLG